MRRLINFAEVISFLFNFIISGVNIFLAMEFRYISNFLIFIVLLDVAQSLERFIRIYTTVLEKEIILKEVYYQYNSDFY